MKLVLIPVLALAVLLGACSTSMNTIEREQPHGRRQMVKDKRIFTDASLRGDIEVVGVNEVQTGDLLKVQLEVVNRTRSLKNFNYRFEWFDQHGMQVSTPASTSIPVQIEGGETVNLSAVAPHPNAKDFRIKMIESTR
jgi:uncharacterized protein YcfL